MSFSRIAKLANRLEQTIRGDAIRYAPGKPFMTTQQLAAHLRIDGTLANNVLRLLEKRRVIIRKQRVGSVVAPPQDDVAIEQVTVFTNEQYYKQQKGFGTLERHLRLFLGIQEMFPGIAFNTSYVDLSRLEEKVSELLSGNRREAFVLWSVGLEVQRLFAESGLPAVVFGTRYFSIRGIPSIEIDHDAATETIVDYLKERGRRRIACLCHSNVAAGDQVMIDGYQKRIGGELLAWRFLPRDEKVYESAVESLLDDRPDAIVCHTDVMARTVCAVCREHDLEPGRDVDMIAYYANPDESHEFPTVERLVDMSENGLRIGRMLKDRIDGKTVDDIHIPVRLKIPGASTK